MKWDNYFMGMLPAIAVKSKDVDFKVGAIIVGPDHEIRSTGYKSFVRGLDDSVAVRFESPEKYTWVEHAERNAIYNAARMGTALKGCTIYIGANPCLDCAKGIISSGISEVVFSSDGAYTRRERYKSRGKKHEDVYVQDIQNVLTMMRECGVIYRSFSG